MNYTHFKIEFVFKEFGEYIFNYNFKFGRFKGLFVLYCDCNEYNKFLIPQNLDFEPNHFKATDKFTFRHSTGSVNLYLIPFGNLLEDFFSLDIEVENPYRFSEVFITIHPFSNKPNPELSTKLHYPLKPDRNSFHKKIKSEDCPQKIVVNQLSQLPTLLGVQDLLLKEYTIIRKTKIKKIHEIQEKIIVTKEAFEDLFEKIATILSSITDLSTDVDDFKKENIELHEKTRDLIEQKIKEIIEKQEVSDLINYLINEKESVKKIMKRVKENLENLPKERIEEYFKSLGKALERYGDISILFAKTRKEKILQGFLKVVKLLSGEIGEWGAAKLVEKIVGCFET